MYKTKILIYFTFIFFIFNNTSFCLENKILIKIEKEIITSIDLENEIKYLLSLNKGLKDFSKKEIFEISKKSIIREKVKNIEIKKKFLNPTVPEDFIEQILKSIYQKIGIENLETFKNYLKENNIDYEYVKDKIEIETLWNELIVAKFTSKITIDEEKIRKKLTTNNKKYSKSFLVSEIFFETSSADEVQIFYNKIKKSIEKDGFDKAALTYSSSNTSSSGGEIGWIQEESLNENLKNIFFKMKEGEFTDPVTVPGGFMILKINGIKEIKKNQNIEQEVKKIINIKTNNQLNQFSKMHFNKVKKDIQINEF